MRKKIDEYKNIHLIGIGGASMYAIASMLKNDEKNVSGSDIQESNTTEYLKSIGVKVLIGHHPEMIEHCDLVIYTAAIHESDPEMMAAKKLGIETVERAEFLGEYTKKYENSRVLQQ